jgi:hypothetical protein
VLVILANPPSIQIEGKDKVQHETFLLSAHTSSIASSRAHLVRTTTIKLLVRQKRFLLDVLEFV